jgi:hypothetical protein
MMGGQNTVAVAAVSLEQLVSQAPRDSLYVAIGIAQVQVVHTNFETVDVGLPKTELLHLLRAFDQAVINMPGDYLKFSFFRQQQVQQYAGIETAAISHENTIDVFRNRFQAGAHLKPG